jgi:hypothetical protein
MHAKTVKRAKKIKIKLDKLNMATTRKTVRQILFSNKKQIAKLTPKSPQWSRHSVTSGHRGDRLKKYHSIGKKNIYLASCSFRGKCLVQGVAT